MKRKATDQSAVEPVDIQSIKERIHVIRGVQVILDFDLAALYGYSTKDFNRQVKNNIEKFDADFMFVLTADEMENLRCKKSTSSWGGARYLPHAFTEQGVYMLMTVLRGDLATRQSKAIVRTFKQMKDYIVQNRGLLEESVKYYGVLVHHTAEKDAKRLLGGCFRDVGACLRCGKVSHYELNWYSVKTSSNTYKTVESCLENLRMTVSDEPRKYIDNTLSIFRCGKGMNAAMPSVV